MAARLLRGPRRRPRRRRRPDQEGLPQARARAAPGRQRARPGRGGEVQGGRGGLRGALGPRAPAALRRLRRTRACAARGYAPDMRGLRLVLATCSRRSSARAASRPRSAAAAAAAAAAAGPRAATSSSPPTIDLADAARGIQVEVAYEAAALCGTCHGNGAEPGTPIVTCRDCDGTGPAPARRAHALRPARAHRDLRRLRRRRARAREALPRVRRRGPRARAAPRRGRHPARASPTASASGSPRRGHAGEHGGPAGDLYVVVRVREDERFLRDGEDLITVIDVPAPLAALGTTVEVPTLRRRRCRSTSRPAPSPARRSCCAAAGCRRSRAAARATIRVVVNVATPRRLSRASSSDLLERFADTITDDNTPLRRGHARQAQAGARRVIRLAVRVPRAAAEIVLAELLELVPGGVEETRRLRRTSSSTRSTARRASCRTCRRSRRRPATRSSTSRPPRCPTTGPSAGRRWHRPVDVAWRFRRLRVRPPWEAALRGRVGHRPRHRPRPGVRHRRAPHHAAVPRAAARARPGRRARRLGLGQRRARDRRGAARLRAGARGRRRARLARGVGRERARQRRRGRGAARQPAARARPRGRRP